MKTKKFNVVRGIITDIIEGRHAVVSINSRIEFLSGGTFTCLLSNIYGGKKPEIGDEIVAKDVSKTKKGWQARSAKII